MTMVCNETLITKHSKSVQITRYNFDHKYCTAQKFADNLLCTMLQQTKPEHMLEQHYIITTHCGHDNGIVILLMHTFCTMMLTTLIPIVEPSQQ